MEHGIGTPGSQTQVFGGSRLIAPVGQHRTKIQLRVAEFPPQLNSWHYHRLFPVTEQRFDAFGHIADVRADT